MLLRWEPPCARLPPNQLHEPDPAVGAAGLHVRGHDAPLRLEHGGLEAEAPVQENQVVLGAGREKMGTPLQ